MYLMGLQRYTCIEYFTTIRPSKDSHHTKHYISDSLPEGESTYDINNIQVCRKSSQREAALFSLHLYYNSV